MVAARQSLRQQIVVAANLARLKMPSERQVFGRTSARYSIERFI